MGDYESGGDLGSGLVIVIVLVLHRKESVEGANLMEDLQLREQGRKKFLGGQAWMG